MDPDPDWLRSVKQCQTDINHNNILKHFSKTFESIELVNLYPVLQNTVQLNNS